MKRSSDQRQTLEHWLAAPEHAGPADALVRACRLADARAPELGAEWVRRRPQLFATLDLIRDLGVGPEALAGCILHALIECGDALDRSTLDAYPSEVRHLVEGQQAAERVWSLYAARGNTGGTEGLRRLLLAIIRDLRVVFILLARQLVRMREASELPEDECREIGRAHV